MEISEIMQRLVAAGGDTTNIEVKSAAGGYPTTVIESLGALANTPTGGYLVFGLDERSGFKPSGIYDVQKLKQRLGGDARSFTPPIHVQISDAKVAGSNVVIAEVSECEPAFKPCTHSSGRAWARSCDGDFLLSDLEKQGFLTGRSAPHFDTDPIPGTSVDDLDAVALDAWRSTVNAEDAQGVGQFRGEDQLRHGAITRASGELTAAGLLMLGIYPQTHFPRHVIQVARIEPDGTTHNPRVLSGAIPRMLTATMEWARANLDYVAEVGRDGNMRNVPAFPLAAIRELVANALVHRDLAPWSEGIAVNLRLYRDRLVISNPGGLHGLTADRLGRETISRSRNAKLVALGVNVRANDNVRVVESLASGLIRVNEQLDSRGLPRPTFVDTGIQFTVILRSSQGTHPQPRAQQPTQRATTSLSATQQVVLDALTTAAAPQSTTEIAASTELPKTTVRRTLTRLRDLGFVEIEDGGRGRITTYVTTGGRS